MKNNNELQKHKSRDMVKWIVVFVSIIMLSTMLTAIITKGFTTADPYGWFEVLKKEKPNDEQIVPEPAKSTPLVVGDKIALWDGAEGKSLYVNTDLNVWNEFYLEYKDVSQTNDTVIFFPFFAICSESTINTGWGTLEGNKGLFPMYFGANGSESYVLMLLDNYDYIISFDVDSETGEYASLCSNFVSEDGRVDFTSRVEKDLPDRATYTVEYVGWEGNILNGEEIAVDDDGNVITIENYLDICRMSYEKVSTEWMNRLFSTTPFIK